jgi:hypothetical protein
MQSVKHTQKNLTASVCHPRCNKGRDLYIPAVSVTVRELHGITLYESGALTTVSCFNQYLSNLFFHFIILQK